jgi:hypothetical protein
MIYLSETRPDDVCVLMDDLDAKVFEVPCPMWWSIEASIVPQDWRKAVTLLVDKARRETV